jgi:hypothetical protein
LPSRALLAGLAGIGLEAGEDGVADLALEGPQRLFAGLSPGDFLVVAGAALAVLVPELGYRGHVDGVVDTPVAAQRQAVDLPVPEDTSTGAVPL